jgi:hypothetical protein
VLNLRQNFWDGLTLKNLYVYIIIMDDIKFLEMNIVFPVEQRLNTVQHIFMVPNREIRVPNINPTNSFQGRFLQMEMTSIGRMYI